MKISVCYITKNEEKNLARSMDSVMAAADEFIVVDTGSIDATREIARSHGGKLYEYTWQDDFSGPRNFAIEQASGDYILFMDADEYVSADTCANLRKLIEQNQNHDALLMKRFDIDQDEANILGEIFVLRAFRRKPHLRYQGRIHEELCDAGQAIADIGVLAPQQLKLYHTGYEASVNQDKAARNLRILQEELKETANPGRLYMYLAEACRGVGDMAAMEHYARLDIAQGRRTVAFASRSYRMLLAYLAEQGRQQERKKLAMAAVRDFPELPEFRAELAICESADYEYEAAVREMKGALARDKEYPVLSLEPKEFSTDMAAVAKEKIRQWQELIQEAGRLKIVTCLIAKNEAQELAEWLKRAAVYSDEIIVVDTGSEDGTAELARKAGARVCSFHWQDDFAAARNFALEQVDARVDWIVFLDADEVFYEPQRLRGALAALTVQEPDTAGIQVPIVNVDVDAWGREIQRFRALRIWRNNPAYRYRGAIHEALYSMAGEIKQVYLPELAVRHTGYSTGRIQQKLTRNLELIMKEMQEQGEQPLHYRYLADCLYGLHEYELAAVYVQKAIKSGIATIAGDGELYRLWLHCARALKQPAEIQLNIIATAQNRGIKDLELLGWQGIIYKEKGDYQQAQPLLTRFLEQASAQDLTSGSNGVQGMLADVYAARACCHAVSGEEEAAREAWLLALQANPYKEEILQQFYQWAKLPPRLFLGQVLSYFSDQEQGRGYLADWAVRFGHGGVIQELLSYLPDNQQKLWQYFAKGEQAKAGEQAKLQAIIYAQELFAALLAMPVSRRQVQSVDCHEWAGMLPAVWQRVIGRFYGWIECFTADDWPGYLDGLTAMQGFVDENVYVEYAGLALDFSWEQVREMAERMAEQRQWRAAYSLLAEVPGDAIGDAKKFWYLTGRCLYHLSEVSAARECFSRAAEAGCQEPDLSAYQTWAARREERA